MAVLLSVTSVFPLLKISSTRMSENERFFSFEGNMAVSNCNGGVSESLSDRETEIPKRPQFQSKMFMYTKPLNPCQKFIE